MFNCIESDALFGLCEGMLLRQWYLMEGSISSVPIDVYVVEKGSVDRIHNNMSECAYRLSDYLLATTPIDIKAD